MSQERNYGGTGASEGGLPAGSHYVALNADECYFYVGRKADGVRIGSEISAFVVDFDIAFDKGNGDKIGAHWQLVLSLSCLHPTLGIPSADAGGQNVAIFKLKIPSLSATRIASVMNALSATDLSWNGWCKVSAYKKGDDSRFSFRTTPYSPEDQYGKTKYAFDAAAGKGLVGVPGPRHTGVFNSGKEILDHREPLNFWLNEAKAFYAKFKGVNYAGNIWPLNQGEFYSENFSGTPSGSDAASSQSTTSFPTEKFVVALAKRFAAVNDVSTAKADIEKIFAAIAEKHIPEEWTGGVKWLGAECAKAYGQLTGMECSFDFNTKTIVVATNTASADEDLPF